MSSSFDPYYTWLGIPETDRPPHYYRLLAIEPFESNPEVIANAGDRLMVYVRTFQLGSHSDTSQRLLNEAAAAKLCLLDSAQKAAYDADLRQRLAQAPVGVDSAVRETVPPVNETEVFGEYQLLEELSQSASGSIYRARHLSNGDTVAVKILSPEAVQSYETFSRVRRKLKILAKLRHPNLVAAFEAGRHDGRYFLSMEYVDGRDLARWIDQTGPLPLQHALSYLRQTATGLSYAHRHGVIHRDVCPQNLLVDNQSGVIKLVGMGLARLQEGADISRGAFQTERGRRGIGTLDYMAPEQLRDSTSIDERADIYSLGCTLFCLLTGQTPYPEVSPRKKVRGHHKLPLPSLSALRPEVPQALEEAFRRMAAKRPEDRFPSMDAVAVALQQV